MQKMKVLLRAILWLAGERAALILLFTIGITIAIFSDTPRLLPNSSYQSQKNLSFVSPLGEPEPEVQGVLLETTQTLTPSITISPSPTPTVQQITTTPLKQRILTSAPTKIQSPTVSPSPSPSKVLSPTPTVTPTVSPTPTVLSTAIGTADPNNEAIWESLADCESHKNWSIDTGNGYYGGLQFSQGAWESVGGSGNPAQASRDEQISRGKLLQQKRGWGVWGDCAKQLGLN